MTDAVGAERLANAGCRSFRLMVSSRKDAGDGFEIPERGARRGRPAPQPARTASFVTALGRTSALPGNATRIASRPLPSLRRLANEAIRHGPQLIAIAQDLEALADRVEEDPTAD